MTCGKTFIPIIAALALSSGGCGTLANTAWFIPEEGGKRVYGGVRADVQSAQQCFETPIEGKPLSGLWCLIDLPFSAIGDTITLPYTIAYGLLNPVHTCPGWAESVTDSRRGDIPDHIPNSTPSP
jgi:uncharacterized protein YceK